MTPQPAGPMQRDIQGHWVRVETLTRVRWLAVIGQLTALVIAYHGFWLRFNLTLCLGVVAVSVLSNLLSHAVYPRSHRLSETETLMTLMFDTAQLSLLLFLTGGLGNPFALLLLAPVTIAASTLPLRGAVLLGAFTVLLITLLALTFQPIALPDGAVLLLPDLFRFGFWVALVIGIAFIGLYSGRVAAEKDALAEALLATQMALAREQKLTDLGGVVAAAAHELGTPLATIKLASAELIDALSGQPELRDDAALIRDQAERCRAILRSMGRAGKSDLLLQMAPLESILDEAAAPHAARGRIIDFTRAPTGTPPSAMPEIRRSPELIHGLRNLIQNAVDFSAGRVRVESGWSDSMIRVRVSDDGPGFPPHLLARIGEPYLRDRREAQRDDSRPGYEGMGLGLFIAKTLLERTGAEVRFSNADPRGSAETGETLGGALVEVSWPRTAIEGEARRALGENLRHDDDIA